ncbi:MAG TPA: hypothetical protein VKP65_13435 [Rhodothermales bacterium]|nr:hypothetical protein [Rhodothermales bacterium]
MKFKKTKEEKIADIGDYTLTRTTYTEDPKGDVKVKVNPPIVIKLDKK